MKFERARPSTDKAVVISIEFSPKLCFRRRIQRDSSKRTSSNAIMDSTMMINSQKSIANHVNNVKRINKRIYLNNFKTDIDSTHPHSLQIKRYGMMVTDLFGSVRFVGWLGKREGEGGRMTFFLHMFFVVYTLFLLVPNYCGCTSMSIWR